METSPPNRADEAPQWYCVLDPRMRQIYLGRDERLARRYWTTGCAIGRAARMGDAIKLAAEAAGSVYRPARPSREPTDGE